MRAGAAAARAAASTAAISVGMVAVVVDHGDAVHHAARARSGARRPGTRPAPRRSRRRARPVRGPRPRPPARSAPSGGPAPAGAARRAARPSAPRARGSRRTHRAGAAEPSSVRSVAAISTSGASMRVGGRAPRQARQDAAQLGVVGAGDDRAVERHLVGEVHEGLLEVVEAAVGLHVLAVEVRDDGDRSATASGTSGRSRRPRPPCTGPRPSRALLPKALSRPPMTAVGSRPARSSTSAIIEVVVVLPCAPATAMPTRRRISSASISARAITGMPRDAGPRRPRGCRP